MNHLCPWYFLVCPQNDLIQILQSCSAISVFFATQNLQIAVDSTWNIMSAHKVVVIAVLIHTFQIKQIEFLLHIVYTHAHIQALK